MKVQEQAFMEHAVDTGGKYWRYDTPLRILERNIESYKELDASEEDFNILNDIRTMLQNHGARPLIFSLVSNFLDMLERTWRNCAR
jgi:hypothetical protein